MDQLVLYSKLCKKCSHMDPGESKTYTKCHFDNGNAECPAKEVQFVIAGKSRRMAMAVIAARSEGDLDREVKILQRVSKQNSSFQLKFKEWLSK